MGKPGNEGNVAASQHGKVAYAHAKPYLTAESTAIANGMLSADNHGMCQNIAMDIATQIRTARAARGISQRKLGRQLGVSGSAVAQWEAGDTKPSILARVDLAGILGIPFVDLVPENDVDINITIKNDPEVRQLVTHFQRLRQKERAVLLTVAVAMAGQSTETSGAAIPPPLPRARRSGG